MEGLEIKQIRKEYGAKRAVDSISFQARAGEIMGILGPNGAGKTTTIRMIMGITAPDHGDIRFSFNGTTYPGVPKSMVGYLPEERGMYKEARVIDILFFLAGLKDVDKTVIKERAMSWLGKFDLEDYANSKVEQLSKGMAQKVQFIASILHQPKLIILDEPFTGLDPVSQEVFKAEIRELADQGATILLSSHQMNIVEELCDRIFLIHQGREVSYGTVQEIKEKYGNYRVTVWSHQDIRDVVSLPSIAHYTQPGSNRWVLTLKDGVHPAAFLASIPSTAAISELSIARMSLHEIFLRIAQGGMNGATDLEDSPLGNYAELA